MSIAHLILKWLYYTAGVAIAIIAGIGLRQLTITKETARTNAKREAFKLAADQCNYYVNHIIPLQDALDHAITDKKLAFFQKSSVEIAGETVKLTSSATPDDLDGLKSIVAESTAAYNAMEAFSVFFASGVADEHVGFSAVGTTFCTTTRKYLPHIVLYRGDEKYFRNIFKLFFLWHSRIESQKLAKQRQQIDSELSKIQNKFIRPIGTE
jgi:hypothetical protein